MKIIVAVDNRLGLMFNHRRLSLQYLYECIYACYFHRNYMQKLSFKIKNYVEGENENRFFMGWRPAANQMEGGYNEGGKGLSSCDVTTSGDKEHPRRVTFKKVDDHSESLSMHDLGKLPKDAAIQIVEGYDYPNHDAIDFYHHYKEDIALLAEM